MRPCESERQCSDSQVDGVSMDSIEVKLAVTLVPTTQMAMAESLGPRVREMSKCHRQGHTGPVHRTREDQNFGNMQC